MKKIFLLLVIFLCTAHWASAEVIYLKSGKVVKGKIVRRTPVFVRIESGFGHSEREFLLENIARIEKDNNTIIYQQEVLNQVSGPSLQDAPEEVKKAAHEMAVRLIEQAMKNVQSQPLDQASETVKSAAHQKASDLLANAVTNMEAPENVRNAAKEMANSLIEETVRSSTLTSLTDAPQEIREAARSKASALIEEAVISSDMPTLSEATDQVKDAARERVKQLIEQEMSDSNIYEEILAEKQTALSQKMEGGEDRSVIKDLLGVPQAGEENVPTSPAVEQNQAPAENAEQVQTADTSVISETILDNGTIIQEIKDQNPPQTVLEVVPETVQPITNEEPAKDLTYDQMAQYTQKIDEQPPQADQVISKEPEQVQPTVSADESSVAPVETATEENKILKLLSGLSIRDYIFITCGVLFLILLIVRIKPKVKEEKKQNNAPMSVAASVTYQQLPDDIKARFTSSEITMILDIEEKFINDMTSAKGDQPVEIDNESIIAHIQGEALKKGSKFSAVDLNRILEVKTKVVSDIG